MSGVAIFQDAQTIKFISEAPLKPETQYEIDFALGKVLDVEKEFSIFKYSIQTKPVSFYVSENGFSPYSNSDLTYNFFTGKINSIDYLEPELIETALQAKTGQ